MSTTSTGQCALRWTCSEIERRSAKLSSTPLLPTTISSAPTRAATAQQRVRRRCPARRAACISSGERRRSPRGRRRASPGSSRCAAIDVRPACALHEVERGRPTSRAELGGLAAPASRGRVRAVRAGDERRRGRSPQRRRCRRVISGMPGRRRSP